MARTMEGQSVRKRTGGDLLGPVLGLTDPIGVLSVYVDADPALAAGAPPAWSAPVRAGLRGLVKEAQRDWPRANRLALEARLDELQPELDSLLDPRGPSRGRALFAGIGGGAPLRVELRSPLPSFVGFDNRAAVLPLLAGLQEGRAAGVMAVLWSRLELSEWEFGELRELETIELETEPEPGSRPATNPSVPQPFPERDRFDTGVGTRVAARVREAGEDMARRANDRGWDYVVADGDPRLLEAVDRGFAESKGVLVRSSRPFDGTSASETAERVAATLRKLRAAATAELVARLDSSPAATRDSVVVERALEEGRVEHLLLAHAADPAGAAPMESLLRRAFETGAEVTVVDLPPPGVAALLRW